MKKKKQLWVFFSLLVLFFQSLTAVPAQAADDFLVNANAGFAIDVDSGKILFNQNGDTKLEIASITKIITSYLVLEAVKERKTTWETPVPISAYAEALSAVPELSNVPLYTSQTYTVKDLYDAMVIQSANAAAAALAELLAGSEHAFVDQMRQKVADWGITDATLLNASGLNNMYLGDNRYPGSGLEDENKLSARDVAVIADHLITDYPEFLETSKTTEATFGEGTEAPVALENWNQMLPGGPNFKEGVDGLKTGTTEKAGACFVGTIQKDGRRVITVILNALNQQIDPGARFVETSNLMDYCFNNWHLQEVDLSGQSVPEHDSVPVSEGKKDTVGLVLKSKLPVWVRNDMDLTQYTIQADLNESLLDEGKLIAPVSKNEKIGKATIALAQDDLGYLEPGQAPSTDIVAKSDVDKANAFVLLWQRILAFFN
ncbi:D-Ala-D-Ala carboxypeptidase [Enterococcus florum]|uniref:serine-type D-Ala-D-Ala carboxypeptidase n=1 Tax=Enterococcus florum TaxID=2480627 RepID=A0A4V0WP80_9ENTE|nr:serine hydrolase [Enterococcus florum]GCF92929.1 D-Ala-D-Ala carboxypeptidase [Enterococcus florum]